MSDTPIVLDGEGPYAGDFDAPLARVLDLQGLEAALGEGLRTVAGCEWLHGARRLVLSGSGDSLFAATSALPALRRWTGLAAECMPSIEFARYETPLLEAGDVLVAVSNSGSSSRTRECLALAHERGVPTVGITGNAGGPLARAADLVLHRPVASAALATDGHGRAILHAAEYIAALTAVYGLALALAQARGRMDDATRRTLHGSIRRAIAALPGTASACEPAARALAEETHAAGVESVWVLGAGPSRGTAEYCAAKFHEQVPLNGVAQDLEEWAHLQYFLTLSWGRRALVFVIAPPGNATDRAAEMIEGIESAGGRAVVVTHASAALPECSVRFDLPAAIPELLSPYLYHLPVQLTVLHLARLAGRSPTPIRRVDDFRLIRGGAVREHARGLE